MCTAGAGGRIRMDGSEQQEVEVNGMHYQKMRICILNNERQNVHIHQEVELYFVLTGQMLITVNKQKYLLQKEEILLVNSNVPHEVELDAGSLAAVFQVLQSFVMDVTNNPFISFECEPQTGSPGLMEELRNLLKNALKYYMSSGGLEKLKEQSYYYLILWHLIRYYSTWDMIWDNETERGRLEEIVKYIQMNYNKQIGLQDLADKFYLSVPYLSSYIKDGLGMGFKDYLSKVRLERAVEDLVHTNHSVTRIAFDNGFANLASFNRVFRKTYQMTPSAYKQAVNSQVPEEETGMELKGDRSAQSAELLRRYFEKEPLNASPEPWASRSVAAKADADQRKEYHRNWMKVLNLGAAEELLQHNVQEHLLELKKGLHYEYGRIWSLFCKENCIDIHTDNTFNFSRLDQILDFMTDNGIVPFLDFGLKPKVIHNDVRDMVISLDRDQDFSDPEQYRRLVLGFMRHCVRRYGEEQVNSWKFELWCERGYQQKRIPASWYDTFEIVYESVKAYAPKAQVGGFGFNVYDSNAAIENFMEFLDRKDCRPDFVSAYLYPYEPTQERHFQNESLIADEDFIEKELNQLQKLIQQKGFQPEQLFITEWNMSISSRNYLHDSCYKGAYIVKNVIASIGKTECMAYWGNTDRIDEYFDSIECLNGAPGLLSRDGIRKPSYFAFEFLNRLGKHLLSRGSNYIITSTDYDEYYIVCHNFRSVNIDYYLQNSEKITRNLGNAFFQDDNLSIEFAIDHVRPGRYVMKKYYVNQQAGSVFDEWLRIRLVEILDAGELAYLSSVSVPHLKSEICQGPEGTLHFGTCLQANEIQMIHLSHMTE